MSSKKILGWILLIAGAGTCIWGIIARNRIQIEETLIENNDNFNAPIIAIIFGIIVAIVGIWMFVAKNNR